MADTNYPLSGLTVIDLSHVYNGPYATFLIDDIPLEVRRDQQGSYTLTAGDDAQELLDMSASDPLLRTRTV